LVARWLFCLWAALLARAESMVFTDGLSRCVPILHSTAFGTATPFAGSLFLDYALARIYRADRHATRKPHADPTMATQLAHSLPALPHDAPFLLTRRLLEIAHESRRELESNPRSPHALASLALVALGSRQYAAAVTMAKAAAAAAPGMGGAWVTLGQALRAEGHLLDAEAAYRQAIRLDGMDAMARLGLGELHIDAGEAEAAIEEFALALRRNPALVAAHLGIGHALGCLNRFEEALAAYERALELSPRMAEAEFAAGFALARLHRAREAGIRYRRAIAIRPDFASAWMNLGCLEREQGRDIFAEAALRRSVALRPDLISGWINLALLLREHGRTDEAESALRRAFAVNPEDVETHIAWAHLCSARGDTEGARRWVCWAQAREPNQEEAANITGILLHAEGRFAEAVHAFARAEVLGSIPAISNRGNSFLELGLKEEALRAHEVAFARAPHSPGARYNLALVQLRLGNWADGWRNYESRWRFREVHRAPRNFSQPRWRGEALAGRRILLHAEQGLGDTIQFCRYAALVAERGLTPILQVQAPAERLVRSLDIVRAGRAEVAILGQTPPPFDVECPLMDLPAVFGTTVNTAPWAGPYLAADPKCVAARRTEFAGAEGNLGVGIAWAGNPRYKGDRQRSVRLDRFLPLLCTPGVDWISLQKGDAASQIKSLPAGIEVKDASSGDRDLADAAATIATLDLVITTDTSIAHLAGAMGKDVWILVPHLADWRWMQETESTPWYPSARLFRQERPGDWQGLMERAAGDLRVLQGAKEPASLAGFAWPKPDRERRPASRRIPLSGNSPRQPRPPRRETTECKARSSSGAAKL
jgi:tetratricopeptide (TPR) repeat protein